VTRSQHWTKLHSNINNIGVVKLTLQRSNLEMIHHIFFIFLFFLIRVARRTWCSDGPNQTRIIDYKQRHKAWVVINLYCCSFSKFNIQLWHVVIPCLLTAAVCHRTGKIMKNAVNALERRGNLLHIFSFVLLPMNNLINLLILELKLVADKEKMNGFITIEGKIKRDQVWQQGLFIKAI